MRRLLTFATLFAALPAAAIDFYYGIDPGSGPGDPRPNADFAAAAFDQAASALFQLDIIDLETSPLGYFDQLMIHPGVWATVSKADPNESGISAWQSVSNGYNITPGGERFIRFQRDNSRIEVPGVLRFEFDTPVQAFGCYITGLGDQSGSLTAIFESDVEYFIPIHGAITGGALFFGFIDPGMEISSVAFAIAPDVEGEGALDIFGVDDIRYVAVPEPASMLSLGLLTLMLRKRRRRN
jgi:hypothetical protein